MLLIRRLTICISISNSLVTRPRISSTWGAARGGSRALSLSAGTGQLATFETHFHFAIGDIVIVPNTIRFMKQAEVAAFLAAARLHGGKLVWRLGSLEHRLEEPGDHRHRAEMSG